MPAPIHLERSSPEEQGISPAAITEFVAEAEKSLCSLHSIMLLRSGKVVAEGWWYPWRAETPHMLFSLSKSFTSTAVGLAVAEGRLRVEDNVLTFFTREAPKKVSENLARMKIKHLLSMSTGHDQDTTDRVFKSHNPYKAFLSLPVEHAPGTHFVYNSAASFMLAAIVQKLSGQTLVEYLTPRLFEPLGIRGVTWETHPNGVNFGGWGLKIKTEDIARFGQLYLQKGAWAGRQILPEVWVEAATSRQVSNGDDPQSDWTQGYGYQFWRCRHNIYRGDGAFGQFCLVMPDQQAVLAITAGVPDMQAVLNVVWEKLLSALNETWVDKRAGAEKSETSNFQKLTIALPQGASDSLMAPAYSGKLYFFEPNYETLRSLRLDFGSEACTMTYQLLGGGRRRGKHSLTIGYGTWVEGLTYLGGLVPQMAAVSGVWTAPDTFTISLALYETPFILSITCRFEDDRLLYDCKSNVAFGPLEHPQLVGLLVKVSQAA